METWGKPSTLVLLTVAVSAMVIRGQNLVSLDEGRVGRVEVPFGSPLTLKCNLNTNRNGRLWVTWYFNPSKQTFNESHKLLEKNFNLSAKTSSRVESEEILLNHTSSATEKNSGWYFCKLTVEIPILKTSTSNGTEVIIKSVERDTTHPSLAIVTDEQAPVSPADNSLQIDDWLWVLVGVSAFILIILLIISVLLRRRCHRSRAEDPIYANTRRPVASKNPSPRPGLPVGNLKTISSSHNLRNPSPGGRRPEEDKLRYKE